MSLSTEYENWKLLAAAELAAQAVPRLLYPPRKVKLELHIHLATASADISNYVKAAEDAIALRMGFNDNRVYLLIVHKFVDKKHPRVEVIVTSLEDEPCQKRRYRRSKTSP